MVVEAYLALGGPVFTHRYQGSLPATWQQPGSDPAQNSFLV